MPGLVDSGFVEWLKKEALVTSLANAGLASGLLASAIETEITSPLALKAAADSEVARQIAILGGPLAFDRHVVKGQRRDLVGQCIGLRHPDGVLGYDASYLGPELVVNGDGSSAVGWANVSGTASAVGGRLRVTNNTGVSSGRVSQAVTLVAGRSYRFQTTHFTGTVAVYAAWVGPNVGSNFGVSGDIHAGAVGADTTFVAPQASAVVVLVNNAGTTGDYSEFDNISLREVGPQPVFVVSADEQDDNLTILEVVRKLG